MGNVGASFKQGRTKLHKSWVFCRILVLDHTILYNISDKIDNKYINDNAHVPASVRAFTLTQPVRNTMSEDKKKNRKSLVIKSSSSANTCGCYCSWPDPVHEVAAEQERGNCLF